MSAVSPAHYQFGDTQVISITRRLTSNGGQAVQYIARATRTDGANKSSDAAGQLEDLRKARVFLDDEIARLEGSESVVEAEPVPRVWRNLSAVPTGTRIKDRDGDVVEITRRGFYEWVVLGETDGDQISVSSGMVNHCGPYTEVLT